MNNTRTIKKSGINPSSYLIHPTTLKMMENKNKHLNTKNKHTDIDPLLLPKIEFDNKTILEYYNIQYLDDLEENINLYSDRQKIRLIKLFFGNNKNIKKYADYDIPKIYEFLERHFNINSKQANQKLTNLITKNNF